MHSLKFKRIVAYMIDFFVVSFLISLLSQINFLNPYNDKYESTLQEIAELQANLTEEQIDNAQFTKDLVKTYSGYFYDLGRYSINQVIIVIVVIVLYYTLFPIYNNNQTIGKRIMKLEIVHLKKNKKVVWYNFFIRSLIYPYYIDGVVVLYLFNILAVLFFSENAYIFASMGIVIVNMIYCYINFIVLILNKDGISIHDRLSGTRVIGKC